MQECPPSRPATLVQSVETTILAPYARPYTAAGFISMNSLAHCFFTMTIGLLDVVRLLPTRHCARSSNEQQGVAPQRTSNGSSRMWSTQCLLRRTNTLSLMPLISREHDRIKVPHNRLVWFPIGHHSATARAVSRTSRLWRLPSVSHRSAFRGRIVQRDPSRRHGFGGDSADLEQFRWNASSEEDCFARSNAPA